MNIEHYQINIINYVKNITKKYQNNNIDTSLSSINYYCSWASTQGLGRLKFFINWQKNLYYNLKITFRSIIKVGYIDNPILFLNETNKKYDKIIISWCSKNQFKKDGSFHDRYFNISTKEYKEFLWILISLDNFKPSNLNDNIKLIINSNSNKFILKRFLNYLLFFFKDHKISLSKFYHYFSPLSIFAKLYSKIIIDEVKKNDSNFLISPYEGQPFQNYTFKELKNINPNLKIIGYHSALPPLPTNMLYRIGSPDNIYVSGDDQKNYLNKYLSWPLDKIITIPSPRFLKDENQSFNNSKIFLPIELNNESKILEEVEKFINFKKINTFEIKNHPLMNNSKIHRIFIKKLNQILSKYEFNYINNKVFIFIGSTSAVVEALERNLEVYHICIDPVFESYTNILWPNIMVNRISYNLFNYKIKMKNKTINLGEKKKLDDYMYSLIK